MFGNLKETLQDLKDNLPIYRRAIRDPRTPMMARLLLRVAVGYVTLPFDVIPDFVPLLGQVDDILIVPVLVKTALWLIPEEVMEESSVSKIRRKKTVKKSRKTK